MLSNIGLVAVGVFIGNLAAIFFVALIYFSIISPD
jgi:hypothetical protein